MKFIRQEFQELYIKKNLFCFLVMKIPFNGLFSAFVFELQQQNIKIPYPVENRQSCGNLPYLTPTHCPTSIGPAEDHHLTEVRRSVVTIYHVTSLFLPIYCAPRHPHPAKTNFYLKFH